MALDDPTAASDFAPQSPDYDPRYGTELQKALSDMKEFQASKVVADKAAQDPIAAVDSMQINKNGQMKATFHKDVFEALMRDQKELQQIRGSFHQEAERLRMQEQALRNQSPWIQLATALSANLAQGKHMPDWVQGLGRTAAQLNPRPEEIQARRLGVLGEEANLVQHGLTAETAQLRAMQMETQRVEAEQGKKIKNFMQDIRLSSKTGEPIPRAAFEAKADLWDIPHEQREALYKGATAQAEGVIKQEERKVTQKKDLLGTANDLAIERGEKATDNRIRYAREAFTITHGTDALEFMRKQKDMNAQIMLGLAQAKSTGVISAADTAKLQGGLSTNTYLSSIDDMLSKPEWGHVAEPLFVVDRGKGGTVEGVRLNPEAQLPKSFQSLERAEADNMLKHEIPRLLALLFKQGVGAQMFRSKEGAKILMDLGVSNSMRLDQMRSILKTIRETNNLSNFQPVAVTKPGVDWSKPQNASMLALDDPNNAEFWSGISRFGGPIPVKRPSAETPNTEKPKKYPWEQ
jgi:hypothetical protein